MKSSSQPFPLEALVDSWSHTDNPTHESLAESIGPDRHPATTTVSRHSHALRWVGILAFGQSLLFLVLWLFLCAFAGAATPPADLQMKVEESAYEPVKTRDPFLPVGTTAKGPATATVNVTALQLQGILYDPHNPSAMVNNQSVWLNKKVTLSTDSGPVEVQAVEITRQRVVLLVGGNKIELRLPAVGQTPNPTP